MQKTEIEKIKKLRSKRKEYLMILKKIASNDLRNRRIFIKQLTAGTAGLTSIGSLFVCGGPSSGTKKLQPIPDKLVVLTFDDRSKTWINFVAPLLKQYNFGATFYITEAPWLGYYKDEQYWITWEELCQLHEMGFEIGNHSDTHPDFPELSKKEIIAELKAIERACEKHGIPRPNTFSYPAASHNRKSVEVLKEKGYLFARRGISPEYSAATFRNCRGPVYDPQEDHPLLIPSSFVWGSKFGPDSTSDKEIFHIGGTEYGSEFEDLVETIELARDGKIVVLTFHGIPDYYTHASTDPDIFEKILKYLHDQKCTVIALRDLVKYVDPAGGPADPFEPIYKRLGIMPEQLTCEYVINPVGVDTAQPRFSWILRSTRRDQKQAAYQIIVSSNEEKLNQNNGDLWDSGKVVSSQSVNVLYQGHALKSGQQYWWKVRCWNLQGEGSQHDTTLLYGPKDLDDLQKEIVSDYSSTASFTMGLLEKEDWQGRWIGTEKGISSPLLRKEFLINGIIKRAMIHVSGLGYYELYINGEKVGDHVLDPATTYYDNDQPFYLGSRVLYVSYDVTDLLKDGRNAMGLMLGNGWYSAEDDIPYLTSFSHHEPFGDRPISILQLNIELSDGKRTSIMTDTTWKTNSGPIIYNDLSNGETYDARLEKSGWSTTDYDDSDWSKALLIKAPGGTFDSQVMPAIKVMETIKPVRILNPKMDVYVFDFGQNFSGWTRLRLSGQRGTEITIRHGARVHDDGFLDARSNGLARQTDTYILKGQGEEVWEPRFTLHGFRYAEVTGFPGTPTLESLEGRHVRSAVETDGYFTCSNQLINQIHHNSCWTYMSSMQGFPQDAAERAERVGWLGDPIPEDYIYNYNTAAFWTKWANDIKDSQKPDGDVPVISPLHWRNKWDEWYHAYNPMPVWKSSYPIVVWYIYQFYEDKQILNEHYDGLKKLVDFLTTEADNHILSEGLGDHLEPQADGVSSYKPTRTPPTFTSTAYYYWDTMIVARAAKIIGRSDDYKRYSNLANTIKNAFNEKFLNKDTNQYYTGTQTANALALYLNMVPQKRVSAVVKNLIDDILIKYKGHLSTGMVGTNALVQALPKYGAADVMYTIATQTTIPGWGYMVSKGATTIWETWDGETSSLNMKLFATVDKFFYKDLAGISPAETGYRQITIKPCVVGDLRFANASVKTVRGKTSSSWEKTDNSFRLEVAIPVNSEARVSVPKIGLKNITITESEISVWKDGTFIKGASGITAGTETNDYVTFDVGSGFYDFKLTGQK